MEQMVTQRPCCRVRHYEALCVVSRGITPRPMRNIIGAARQHFMQPASPRIAIKLLDPHEPVHPETVVIECFKKVKRMVNSFSLSCNMQSTRGSLHDGSVRMGTKHKTTRLAVLMASTSSFIRSRINGDCRARASQTCSRPAMPGTTGSKLPHDHLSTEVMSRT
jgi:hypothetical protein